MYFISFRKALIVLAILFLLQVEAQELPKMLLNNMEEGLHVDLREPTYTNGVLSTSKGGVVTGPQLRIQAMQIHYFRKDQTGAPSMLIEAEGQLLIEFGDYIFKGKKLIYDFKTKQGVIYEACTEVEPWFLCGERFELLFDGSYIIHHGYVTTSEESKPDWSIDASRVQITPDKELKAEEVRLRFYRYNILWVPSLKANLESIFDSPIRYRFRWGGRQGPRLGITYEVYSTSQFKLFARLDLRLTRGPGFGIEASYLSADHLTEFHSTNYIAKDSSLIKPDEKIRYRYEGMFSTHSTDKKVSLYLSYDKISDLDMPSNYCDWDFNVDKTQRTQLLFRQQAEQMISTCYLRLRLNNFQTVKEELPTYTLTIKPFEIGRTGILFENQGSFAFLNYKYSHDIHHIHHYASSRVEYSPLLYRAFRWGPCTFTPELGGASIFYGNTPERKSRWLLVGMAGCELQTRLYHYYSCIKHVVEPYVSYRYFSSPNITNNEHYIFDIHDGYEHLNQCTWGATHNFFFKNAKQQVFQLFSGDIYAHAFFNAKHLHPIVPKIYGTLNFSLIPTLTHTLESAWDFQHRQIDHFNFRSEWTLSDDFAISAEFRHRDAFSWRKVDLDNFFLEAAYSAQRLKHSSLSDRRDTFLLHFFYRFLPTWALEFTSRQGWNRRSEPNYTEYEIDLLTTIQTAWHLRISFQHKEDDNRIALYMNMGINKFSSQ